MNPDVFTPPEGATVTTPVGAPIIPPAEWFTEWPEWADPTSMTPEKPSSVVTVLQGPETGRVAGVFAQPGQCYLNDPTQCWTAQPDPSGYTMFHRPFAARAGDGSTVMVDAGVLGAMNGGHAPDQPSLEREVSTIANPDLHLAVVRAWDMVWSDGNTYQVVTGCLVPEATVGAALYLNRSGLSGVWRCRHQWATDDNEGGCRGLGPQVVTRPALPHRPMAGVRAAAVTEETNMETMDLAGQVAELRDVVAGLLQTDRTVKACACQTKAAADTSAPTVAPGDVPEDTTGDTTDQESGRVDELSARVDSLTELVETLARHVAELETAVAQGTPIADIPDTPGS